MGLNVEVRCAILDLLSAHAGPRVEAGLRERRDAPKEPLRGIPALAKSSCVSSPALPPAGVPTKGLFCLQTVRDALSMGSVCRLPNKHHKIQALSNRPTTWPVAGETLPDTTDGSGARTAKSEGERQVPESA